MQTNNDSIDKTIVHQCSYCAKVFKYESDKKRHETSHNPQFSCNICQKKFSFLSALNRHKKQHDRSDKVECEKCGKSFKDDVLLQRHYDYAHKGTHFCKQCKSVFHSALALKNHMKIHKSEDRRYVCSHTNCGKTFYSTQHLRHHELNHTSTKQFYCDDCGKGFIQRNHLKSHMMMHRPEDWLPCLIEGCKKTFPTEYARKRHLDTHKKKKSNISKLEMGVCKEYFKEPQRKIKSSKNTKRQLNHVLKENDVSSYNRVIIAKGYCSNANLEKQYKDEVKNYICEAPTVDFEYNNVIEIIKADTDARKEIDAIINHTKSPDNMQVVLIRKPVKILKVKEFEEEKESFAMKTDSAMSELTLTQDALDELTSTQNAIDKYTSTEDAIDEFTVTHNSIKELTRTEDTMGEFTSNSNPKVKFASTQDAIGEITSTQNALDELASTQDAIDEFTSTQNALDELASTQDAIDEFTSKQNALDELASTQDAIDEFTSTQNALDELASTQDAIDKFTSTQNALDELASTQNAIDEFTSKHSDATAELPSNTDMVDDFRCGDCDCTSIKLKDLDFINNINDKIELPLCKKVMPNLEHREDGSIKLTDTFEFDSFPDDEDVDDTGDDNSNHICKALFGNCIVSGNSEVSDKCICAKISKSQNVEDIEDITSY